MSRRRVVQQGPDPRPFGEARDLGVSRAEQPRHDPSIFGRKAIVEQRVEVGLVAPQPYLVRHDLPHGPAAGAG
jgi:hypothetical protein